MLSLQTAAANLTPWTSLCQHFKLNLEESFQSNWLHEKGQNAILTNAFEEAKEKDYQTLSDMSQKFEGKKLDWIFSMTDYPKILEFIPRLIPEVPKYDKGIIESVNKGQNSGKYIIF